MWSLISRLLSAADVLPIQGEYKLWLYHNYIVSMLQFHLSVEPVTKGAITEMENLTVCHLKKWLNLLRSLPVLLCTTQMCAALQMSRYSVGNTEPPIMY